MRHTVVVISDLHAGSSVALHPDSPTPMDDGGTYTSSPAQQWVWSKWLDFWGVVKKTAKRSPLTVIVNGDAVEGNHHGTYQLVSAHPGVQVDVLQRCVAPVLALHPARIIIVRGTETHVGTSATAEEGFARWLTAQGCGGPRSPEGNAAWWHFRGEFGGVRIDAAHHGRSGARPWTKGSAVTTLASQIFYEHAEHGMPIPHLAFRSHKHQFFDTHDAAPVRVIQTPAWQLSTAYTHKIAPGAISDLGGHIVTIEDGQYDVRTIRYRPDPVPLWRAAS